MSYSYYKIRNLLAQLPTEPFKASDLPEGFKYQVLRALFDRGYVERQRDGKTYIWTMTKKAYKLIRRDD